MGQLCERHTTSKITSFDDLLELTTHGFRGEALASLSQVGHVTVTTRTAASACGYRASYLASQLRDGEGQEGAPKPVAATVGTTIQVDDLFYNVPLRRAGLKSANDEYGRALEVVSRYAIHYSGRIGISCKKHASTHPDLSTNEKATALDNIATIFGAPLRRELVAIDLTADRDDGEGPAFRLHGAKIRGYVSSANYSAKKSVFVIFINSARASTTPD